MAAGRANSGQRRRRTTPQPALRDDRRAGAVAKRASPRAARTRSDRERVSARRHLRDDGARAAARPRRAAEPRRFRDGLFVARLSVAHPILDDQDRPPLIARRLVRENGSDRHHPSGRRAGTEYWSGHHSPAGGTPKRNRNNTETTDMGKEED